MKALLIVLALCSTDGQQCVIDPDGMLSVYTYERLGECVQAKHWFEERYEVEAHCASDEISPADYFKG